uniref:Uncharacterized protein n=1 Tax=Pseudomonas putida TaxID=303 RepID=A0A6B7PWZ3_PSEPU|nr:hypothetical protein [Pseudomonas putida]
MRADLTNHTNEPFEACPPGTFMSASEAAIRGLPKGVR